MVNSSGPDYDQRLTMAAANRIGSLLARFEETIHQNEKHGGLDSRMYLTSQRRGSMTSQATWKMGRRGSLPMRVEPDFNDSQRSFEGLSPGLEQTRKQKNRKSALESIRALPFADEDSARVERPMASRPLPETRKPAYERPSVQKRLAPFTRLNPRSHLVSPAAGNYLDPKYCVSPMEETCSTASFETESMTSVDSFAKSRRSPLHKVQRTKVSPVMNKQPSPIEEVPFCSSPTRRRKAFVQAEVALVPSLSSPKEEKSRPMDSVPFCSAPSVRSRRASMGAAIDPLVHVRASALGNYTREAPVIRKPLGRTLSPPKTPSKVRVARVDALELNLKKTEIRARSMQRRRSGTGSLSPVESGVKPVSPKKTENSDGPKSFLEKFAAFESASAGQDYYFARSPRLKLSKKKFPDVVDHGGTSLVPHPEPWREGLAVDPAYCMKIGVSPVSRSNRAKLKDYLESHPSKKLLGLSSAQRSCFSAGSVKRLTYPPAFVHDPAVQASISMNAATKIQALVRGYCSRLQPVRTKAAIVIQAAVRGHLRRLHHRLFVLEGRLEETRSRAHKDLTLVELAMYSGMESYKDRKMRTLEKKNRSIVMSQMMDERLKEMAAVISTLTEENHLIQEQNQKLLSQTAHLVSMNARIEKSTGIHNANFHTIWKASEALNERNKKLEDRCDRYKQRLDKQNASMAALRARKMQESRKKAALESGLQAVLEAMEARCDDVLLVQMLDAMASGDWEESEEVVEEVSVCSEEAEDEGFMLSFCIQDEDDSILSDLSSLAEDIRLEDDSLPDDMYYEEVDALDEDCEYIEEEVIVEDDEDEVVSASSDGSSVWMDRSIIL